MDEQDPQLDTPEVPAKIDAAAFVAAATSAKAAEYARLPVATLAGLLRDLPTGTRAIDLMLATPSEALFEKLMLAMPDARRCADAHFDLFVRGVELKLPLQRLRRLLALLDGAAPMPWQYRALEVAIHYCRADLAGHLMALCESGAIDIQDVLDDLKSLGVVSSGVTCFAEKAQRRALAKRILRFAARGDVAMLRLCFQRFGDCYRELDGPESAVARLMSAAVESGVEEATIVVYLNTCITHDDWCNSVASGRVLVNVTKDEAAPRDGVQRLMAPVTSEVEVKGALARVKEMDKDVSNRISRMVTEAFDERGYQRELGRPVRPEAFEPLKESFPLFIGLIDQIQARASLLVRVEAATGRQQAMRLPNVLIVGKPGWGKTYFIHCLGEVLGLPFHSFQMSAMSAGFVLSGSDPTWSTSRPGMIHDMLVRGDKLNPIVLLDEIDKASGDARYPSDGALYQLLEPEQARGFRDECLSYPIDASHINWFASANDLERAHPAIVSRFDVFEIPEVTPEIARKTARSVYRESLARAPWGMLFDPEPREDVIEALARHAPREAHHMLQKALGRASLAGRSSVVRGDFDAPSGITPRKIGFVH